MNTCVDELMEFFSIDGRFFFVALSQNEEDIKTMENLFIESHRLVYY